MDRKNITGYKQHRNLTLDPARVLPGFLQRKRSWREIPEREHSYKGPNVGTLGHILVAEEFQRINLLQSRISFPWNLLLLSRPERRFLG
jgi:hypothetical protein